MRCCAGLRLVLVAALLLACVRSVAAQDAAAPRRAPIAGSMVYHLLLYGAPYGQDDYDSWGMRFAGRLALRLHDQLYAGFAIGSWHDGQGSRIEESGYSMLTLDRSAVASQVYVQAYPVERWPLFLRLGGGMGQTWTLEPNGSFMRATDHVRALWSGGVGIDFSVGRQLHITPSVDYHVMPAVSRKSAELRSALAVGVGLTLR